jgi:cytidine deaminase
MFKWISRLLSRARQRMCSHSFDIEELRMVNPEGDKDRVEWPCATCRQMFRAHCGLDISPSNGPTFRMKKVLP